LNSPSTSVGDYQTNDLDRPAASLNGLALCRRKTFVDETCDQGTLVFAARDELHNEAVVLRDFLIQR
jgi:uncharacterized protein YeaO (DUF488 family)